MRVENAVESPQTNGRTVHTIYGNYGAKQGPSEVVRHAVNCSYFSAGLMISVAGVIDSFYNRTRLCGIVSYIFRCGTPGLVHFIYA